MALKDKWQQDRIGRQQGVQERQQQVQTTLSLWQQERQNQASEFREDLEYRVRDLLANYQKQHQQMAAQLQQQLQQSRTERKDAVQKLFEDLGVFRAELQDYHLKLQQTVWGSSHRKPRKAITPQRSIPSRLYSC
uniref:Gas vesicle protein GvpC n=1 Tax=Planktothrix rubescens TaxID=59512 RepID=Q8GBW9_PLARU|nr:gas vesicle protein GvpC [Planktothrix rubescens]